MTTFNTQNGFNALSSEGTNEQYFGLVAGFGAIAEDFSKETYFGLQNGYNAINADLSPIVILDLRYENLTKFNENIDVIISNNGTTATYSYLAGKQVLINLFVDDSENILDTFIQLSGETFSNSLTITSLNYTPITTVIMYKDTIRQDSSIASTMFFSRALNQAELNQIYNNSNIVNPLLRNFYKMYGSNNGQQEMKILHIANSDLFYDDNGVIKWTNSADISTLTDATSDGYVALPDGEGNIIDIRENRKNTEIL